MNKIFLSFLLFSGVFSLVFSQNVGINPTGALPDASAILDVSSPDKGMLVPRIALTGTTDVLTIPSAATSLLVFNTANVADVTPGYYYWNGTIWVRLATGLNSDWSLTGNAGTTAGTNFIGTTDATDFVTKTNNLERLRVTSGGYVGINTPIPLAYLHVTTQPGVYALRLENSVGVGMLFKNQGQPLNSKNWVINNSGTLLSFGALNDAESGVYNPFVINRNGFVGINTSTPSTRLEIRGTTGKAFTAPQNILKITSDDAVNPLALTLGLIGNATATSRYGTIDVDDAGTRRHLILQSVTGNVGIGTVTPTGQLELSLDQGLKPGTNTWTITSDERLKTIYGAYTKGLDEILRLNAITYSYKNVGERTFADGVLANRYVGFSAQEVQKIFPEAVSTDRDGYLNFNMHAVLVAYTNAIKELDAKNKELEERISKLEMLMQTSVKKTE